jgi:hypothetical protein
MAWILYTDEHGARVENDEDGSTVLYVPSARTGALATTAATDALRAVLSSSELSGDTFIDDDKGVTAVGISAFEAALAAPDAPPSRHAGKFPHLGVP